MNDIAIKVENVSKQYSIGDTASYLTLRDKLASLPTILLNSAPKTKTFWALKDVSFEIKKGEIVGIIGRNGAGKSTLLKILSRITEPTSGKITMHGRVASMLEVGTGFNPELTGRENIYLNGAIIGMKKSEIEARFEDIVEFAGVGKFLDTPVKHYSSGMYVRLAFAVAAHLDSDILLIDEVLAVGDLEFQKKCLGKMSELSSSGKTVIYVTHDMGILNSITTKAIFLESGQLTVYSTTQKVTEIYYDTVSDKNKERVNRYGSKQYFVKCELIDKLGKEVKLISAGETYQVIVKIINMKDVSEPAIGIIIRDGLGNIVFSTNTQMFPTRKGIIKKVNSKQTIAFLLQEIKLSSGVYAIDVSITTGKPGFHNRIDFADYASTFEIAAKDYYKTGFMHSSDYGPLLIDGNWDNLNT